jgi:hypothetical protein
MIDSNNINHYLTADEAVQILGCSKRTLRRYVSQGLVGKRGKGRSTRYSGMSVMLLSRNEGSNKLDKVIDQLKLIQSTQQEILARLTLLESIFMPRGGTVDLTDPEVNIIKAAINDMYSTYPHTYELLTGWSDDLLKLSEKSCKGIGYTNLVRFADYLISLSEQLDIVKRQPKKKILIEKFRWFKSRLKSYASI